MTLTLQTMPVAAATDSADLPHILGDPADTLWEGVAERCVDNFAAFNTWTAGAEAAYTPVELTGTAVFTPNANWAGTNGYEYLHAWYVTLANGVKLVSLDCMVVYKSATTITTGPFGNLSTTTTANMGVIAAAIRPVPATMRIAALWYDYTADSTVPAILNLSAGSTGQVNLSKCCAPGMSMQNGGTITFSAVYSTVA